MAVPNTKNDPLNIVHHGEVTRAGRTDIRSESTGHDNTLRGKYNV